MSKQKEPVSEQAESDDVEAIDEHQQAQTEQIMQTGAITTTKGKHCIHCLTIVGQVEGHYILPPQNKTTKYEHVIPQLVAIQETPEIDGLIIILNTVGGDVEAGLAIAELVSGLKKPTVSLVLGGGHSIGVPLAVSAKRSFIVPSATMTIHPVRMNGLVLGVPQTLSYFDKMQERIVRFVEENSYITGEKFRKLMMTTGELMMDVGTVLDGQQAVQCGLIDELGGLSDAVQCLYDMIEKQKNKDPEDGMQKLPVTVAPKADAQPKHVVRIQKKSRRATYAPAAIRAHMSQGMQHKIRQGTRDFRQSCGENCESGGGYRHVNPFGEPGPNAR